MRQVFPTLHALLSACALLTAFLPSAASEALAAGLADVSTTRHNLADSSGGVQQEVCVFCHAPSGLAEPGMAAAQKPQWQQAIAVPHQFSTYDDLGRAGRGLQLAIGSPSLACLSCHDSTQAAGITSVRSFDHPFGVPYRGSLGGRPLDVEPAAAPDVQPGTRRLRPSDFRPAMQATIDGATVWWVPSGAPSPQRDFDDLPLYTNRSESAETAFVECTTCHNPHAQTPKFLRMRGSNVSTLCVACHQTI
ncbi:MAG TPA: cytochrome c3 family protein [Pelomicrobium sp.]|nr:cytochrome c3 family protein [Pelomicrobium sp.]